MAADITVQENNTLSINGQTRELNNGANSISVTATHPTAEGCEKQVNIEVYKCYLSTAVTGYTYNFTSQDGQVIQGSRAFGQPLTLKSGESITFTGVVSTTPVTFNFNPETYQYDSNVPESIISVTITDNIDNRCVLQTTIEANSSDGGTFNPPSPPGSNTNQ